MKLSCAALVIVAVLTWFAAEPARTAPITFNTALPVAGEEAVVRTQVIWSRSSDDPSAMDRDLNVLTVPAVIAYGLHSRVTLFGILPFVYKHIGLTTPTGRETRSTTGFGDLSTFIRVTALRFDAPGRTGRLAPFVGVKMPTGADDEGDQLGRFPQPFQLGSGSWDPFLGLVFTWQTLDWEVDLSAAYQFRTEANDFEAGDELRGDMSFQYRVVPWGELGDGLPSFVYAVVESNVVWRAEDQVAGAGNPNSGGLAWYVAPGVQWVTLRTVLEAAVQIPVLQELNGSALQHDFVARLSFRANF